MAKPNVPDVKAAAWHHPYRFSGRLPFRALLFMVGAGFIAALIAGVGGYFGGAVTRWIGVQTTHLATAIVKLLANWGFIGRGVGIFMVVLPVIIIGFAYPYIIGSIAGVAVAEGAKAGRCRMPWLAGLLGFLAGGVAYISLVGSALLMKAPLHESSRILEVVNPPVSYVLMVVDCLIVLYAATSSASSIFKNPYCESCGKWFGSPKTLTIPVSSAAALVEALASRSAFPLQGVPVGSAAQARIQLDQSRCECGQSDYNLVAALHWEETKKDKSESKTQTWFSTTLPASLGAEIERWSTSTQLPAAAQQQTQTPTQEHNEEASPLTLMPQEATSLHPAERPQATTAVRATPTPVAVQPTEQSPNAEICKRCGHAIGARFTCPNCGNTQWGMLIGVGVFSLVCLVGAIFWGLHISVLFWRAVVMWGGGCLGGFVLLFVIVWVIKGITTPRKPLSQVVLEPDASKPTPTGPKVFEAATLDPTQEIPIEKAVEIDWLSISNICRRGDYEEMARILSTLDKRSNREYASDKKAYGKTCDLIKEVGKQLDRKGGEELMKQVLVRAGSLGCNTRFIEGEWDGIGTWLG